MSSTWYDGYVPMTPKMEEREFFSGDDDFTCKVPKIVYKCDGETNTDHEAFEWSTNSVIVAGGSRIIEYVEDTFYELLMTDLEDRTLWAPGPLADCMGWDVENVKEIRKIEKRYIDEFDFNKMEKRRYRLVLEGISEIDDCDRGVMEDILGEDIVNCDGYTMEVSEYL